MELPVLTSEQKLELRNLQVESLTLQGQMVQIGERLKTLQIELAQRVNKIAAEAGLDLSKLSFDAHTLQFSLRQPEIKVVPESEVPKAARKTRKLAVPESV